ncbi:MAG TPA: exodeoxyribonuclease VII small subunit [Candidatus Andersenbacteria bacterium]|nr:exodeoxyribonuclease VII small subunit [Candidatus Andersenbacteria bacterium]
MAKVEKKFDFTKGYEELEGIVQDFESRELDLEKDLPKFEQGLKLAKQLQERLKEIKNTVREIEKTYS